MKTLLDWEPYKPFTVGFDTIMDRLLEIDTAIPNYPPYNIRKTDELEYVIDLAVAGFGKDDILALLFTAEAKLTRARFHLKGQESADWAKWLKQVQEGIFDQQRADTHALPEEELESKTFPTNCPNCMATVPPQPRGVKSMVCEFCNSTINAE